MSWIFGQNWTFGFLDWVPNVLTLSWGLPWLQIWKEVEWNLFFYGRQQSWFAGVYRIYLFTVLCLVHFWVCHVGVQNSYCCKIHHECNSWKVPNGTSQKIDSDKL